MNIVASTSARFWAFWALPCSPETARHWLSLVVTGKVGFLAVRTACQMYFPSNCEPIDEL